jgi:hypothetical protein
MILHHRQEILANTEHISNLTDGNAEKFKVLSQRIHYSKNGLETKNVVYIIIQILNQKGEIYAFKQKKSFEFWVIGSYKRIFQPTKMISDALSEFFLEHTIIPEIKAVPISDFNLNSKFYIDKLKRGVIIYDREKGIS